MRGKKHCFSIGTLLLSVAAGSLLTFLFATREGKIFRTIMTNDVDLFLEHAKEKASEIINKAKLTANEIYKKTEEIIKISKEYAAGKYHGTKESFEKETEAIHSAYKAAIESYKHFTDEEIDHIDNYDWLGEYDLLPKQLGMRRRSFIKRFS